MLRLSGPRCRATGSGEDNGVIPLFRKTAILLFRKTAILLDRKRVILLDHKRVILLKRKRVGRGRSRRCLWGLVCEVEVDSEFNLLEPS